MRRLVSPLLFAVFAGFCIQPARAQLPVTTLPADAAPDTPGWHEKSIDHDGLTRWFLVYLPEDMPARAPAVVLLHGGTGGMRAIFNDNQSTTREWPYLAEREKFILIVPNGVNPDTGDTTGDQQNWNDLREPGSDRDSDADDVGFLRKLVNHAVTGLNADPLRVYFTGSSNGGTMTMRMAMEAAGRIAAAAIAISNLPEYDGFYSEPARPVPFMFCNGTEDPLMTYEGSPGSLLSAATTAAWWIERNNASPTAAEDILLADLDPSDDCLIRRRNHPALPGGAPVAILTVEGGGHVTPSINHHIPQTTLILRLIGRQCHDVETAEVQWEFLSRFSVALAPRLDVAPSPSAPAGTTAFQLKLSGGHPGGHAVLESSARPGASAWTEIDAVTLDDLGAATIEWLPQSGPAAFVRAGSHPQDDSAP
ncbi:MAG: alpha/beta hydrolase family esterase [Verrucomicrobiota bacterium JB025]|nr:hypothetical protein [Verrucomicrobiota bacterium JB025]